MLNSDLCVNLLMVNFRILLALNIVNLIFDSAGDPVDTILIIVNFQLYNLSYLSGNRIQLHTRFVSAQSTRKDTST